MFLLFLIISFVLTKLWMGIMNVSMLEDESLESIEKRQPYLPSLHIITGSILATSALFLLSLRTINGIAPFNGPDGWKFVAWIFGLFGLVAGYAQYKWPRKSKPYLFAIIIGTVVTFSLIGFKQALFTGHGQDPFMMALGVVCIIVAWQFLFGPWTPLIKAVVLGTFLFWVGVHLIFRELPSDRTAHLIAIGIAFIPAVIWCWLFLEYHKQRKSVVVLMFFAGMISTAPILFYDAMVRGGVELQFFLFRIVPESFTRSSNVFVSSSMVTSPGVETTLMSTLIAFLLVGLIEECSKFWVLKKSGQSIFTSIDDVMQLAIIVAIGFAFAENVLNPTYFIAFVREYIVNPPTPDWSGFMGNILGRSILTNMVHIVSTGVLGYFFGMALFARPYLEDIERKGKKLYVPLFLHWFLRLPVKEIFRREMMIIGFVLSILMHGLFNFMVTLPDILPGNPRTIGDIFNLGEGSPFNYIAILVVPSLLYVVGGFWLLSTLFYKKECMKERGHILKTDTFIQEKAAG